jgi:thioredoxin 1
MAAGNMGSVVPLGTDDLETVAGSKSVALVEFYTEWCGTCQRMEPVLREIAADTDAAVVTVDIEDNLETAIEFGAQSAPTFVVFADGRPVKTLRGAQSEATLRDIVATYS